MRSIVTLISLFAVVCNFAGNNSRADEAAPASTVDATAPFVDPFARTSLVAQDDSERIARARAMRLSGISLVAVGTATTIASQVLLGLTLAYSNLFCLDPCVVPKPFLRNGGEPFLIGAITTVVVGNAMLATGLALWSRGSDRLGHASGSVGTLSLAPTGDGHGAQGGLVVHF
ncbi:MAG TPA: hypothetical protein VIA18_17390 [Polyangia bacterium]|jgi:hypothetical protein|nr:hypothetical protein [Polyangia bacterium]HWE31695.1 hypothetical protein [Polyangia bacterium]